MSNALSPLPFVLRRASRLCALGAVAASLSVTTHADEPPPDLSGGERPALFLAPIEGFTSGWHGAPAELPVPVGRQVRFYQEAPAEAVIEWTGARQYKRDDAGSLAECTPERAGPLPIRVRCTLPDQSQFEQLCTLLVQPLDPADLRPDDVGLDVAPLLLDENSSNDETMFFYFGFPSIADLHQLGPARYLTSVLRELHLTARLARPELAGLVEWRINGHPVALGPVSLGIIEEPGVHLIEAGPPSAAREVTVETYRTTIVAPGRGERLPDDKPIEFMAATEPPGYEHLVRWISSTKYGSATPVVGLGPTFIAEFRDTWGPDTDGGLWQWMGVRGDNDGFGQDQKCPFGLIIETPSPGQALANNVLTWIVAQLDPPIDDLPVDGQIFAQRPGGPLIPIAQGDIRGFATPDRLVGLWDPSGLPSGPWEIIVRCTVGECATVEQRIPVNLNAAPFVDMVLLNCQPRPDGVAVLLEALASDPDGDPIHAYLWDPGDGSPEQYIVGTSQFSHVYQPTTTVAIVKVTAYDARGATSTQWRDLEVPICNLNITHDCGCDKMDIFSAAGNPTFIQCANPAPGGGLPPLLTSLGCAAVAAPPAGACPAGRIAYTCPLGPVLPPAAGAGRFGWFFEVNAHVHPMTNDPAMCSQGQIARGTYARGPAVGPPAPLPNPAQPPGPGAVPALPGQPAGGFPLAAGGAAVPGWGAPNWGRDDYTAPSGVKSASATRWRWIDAPSFEVRAADGQATQQAEFVMWVTGNLNTCWCWIQIQHSWSRAGGHAGIGGGAPPAIVTRVMGHKCN